MRREVAEAVKALSDGLTITEEIAPGRRGDIPVRRYLPRERTEGAATLVWAHGGGFAFGGLDMPESHAVASAIAREGREVVAVDYRRVPMWNIVLPPRKRTLKGIRYPVPVDDLDDAYEYVRRSSTSSRFVLGGASAGASLAASVALRRLREGAEAPAALIFAFGLFHAELPPISAELAQKVKESRGGTQFNPSMFAKMTHNFAGSPEAVHSPFAFAGGKDLTGFPPSFLLNADADTLRASGEEFARELHAAGGVADSAIVPGSKHGFLNEPLNPAFAVGITHLLRWLSERDRRARQ